VGPRRVGGKIQQEEILGVECAVGCFSGGEPIDVEEVEIVQRAVGVQVADFFVAGGWGGEDRLLVLTFRGAVRAF
jgi:hypothetical protein